MMASKKLSTVTSDVIEASGNTAKNVIDAYRVGGERVVTALEQRWSSAMSGARAQLQDDVASNASAAQKAFSTYYTKGLVASSSGAYAVVGQMVKIADAGVVRAASASQAIEAKTGLTTLSKIAKAALPGALAISAVAAQMEKKSAALVAKAKGESTVAKVAKRASAFRKARAA
jgi:hypothetical protein